MPGQLKSPKIEDDRPDASPPPKKLAATRMTNRNGRLSMTSTMRIRRLSTKPPKKPAIAPTIVPIDDADRSCCRSR